MTLYDQEVLHIQKLLENYGHTLRRFQEEFHDDRSIERPTIELVSDYEFIITVPYLLKELKVQYAPFIYGGLTVEIKYD